MSGLHPPRSPTTSPAPSSMASNNKVSARVSMGPQARPGASINPASLALPSPRVGGQQGGARPTSELLVNGGASMFQTPEAEAIDQWFENLQNYEVTLEEMAAASLDVNFKEELAAIEQWFRILSEGERTAALYSLLQQSTQVQIRFFITVLQQMARSDPMTALLSPSAGSMQNQMESKLASLGLKSPGLVNSFNPPASPSPPSARGFAGRSLNMDSASSFLSPDSVAANSNSATDPAATLAHQRARLQSKANAAHRISAPPLAGNTSSSLWGAAASGGNQLGQVVEQEQQQPTSATRHPPSSNTIGARPKSMDLSSLSNLRSPRLSSSGPPASVTNSDADTEAQVPISPPVGGLWSSMVNTPAVPMFTKDQNGPGGKSLYNSTNTNVNTNNSFVLEDAKVHRRPGKGSTTVSKGTGVYGDDGSSTSSGQQPRFQGQSQHGLQPHGNRNVSGGYPGGAWGGARSPAMSPNSMMNNGMGNLGGMGGMGGMGRMGDTTPLSALGYSPLASPGMMNMNMNMMGMPGLNMNLLANLGALAAAGMTPEAQAQFLATAQMAALQPHMMNPLGGFNMNRGSSFQNGMGGNNHNNRPSTDKRGSTRTGGGDKPDEEVDPSLLEDIPAWLRSLRLHKYTPNFQDMNWKQMVVMNDQQLEDMGVAAVGARRKMIKTFEVVRAKMGIPEPVGSTTNTTTTTSGSSTPS